MYRLYNPNTSDHHYTISTNDKIINHSRITEKEQLYERINAKAGERPDCNGKIL
jgi:hypothetical protein